MNYTFLPELERYKIKSSYRVRALVVLFLALSLANIFGIVSLFPTYINSKVLEDNELAMIQVKRNEKDVSAETVRKDLIRDNLYISNAEQMLMTPTFYDPIRNIILAKGAVRLSSIAVSNFSTSTISFSIQGISPSRVEISDFKHRLENIFAGAAIDLPPSYLAKNKDVEFSLNLTIKI